jgi:cytoskeleton protein RodZ
VKAKVSEPVIEDKKETTAAAATLGERLRRARESRGISLREISEHSRIPLRYLESIEINDYRPLPGGIFNRSFVKAYARHVGMNEKEALEGYEMIAAEQGATSKEGTLPQHPRVYTDGTSTRSPFVTFSLAAIMLGVLALVIYAGLNWYERYNKSNNDQAFRTTEKAIEGNKPINSASVNQTNTALNSSPEIVSTDGFKVVIKAKQEVWVRLRTDQEKTTNFTLKPDEVKELLPKERLLIQYAKDQIDPLDITVNNRPIAPPVKVSGLLTELAIEKTDYEKFLR